MVAKTAKLSIRARRTTAKVSAADASVTNAADVLEIVPFLIVKRDGTRQSYDRSKLKSGIMRSCEKRPISMQQIDRIVDDIEKSLYNSLDEEVTSQKIGDMVMERLKEVDEVAYIRFAAVYRQFKDSATFFEEMSKIFNTSGKGKKKN